jgi:hypothetical protein
MSFLKNDGSFSTSGDVRRILDKKSLTTFMSGSSIFCSNNTGVIDIMFVTMHQSASAAMARRREIQVVARSHELHPCFSTFLFGDY